MPFSDSSRSFERLIWYVVAEMVRSSQRYTSRFAPFAVARDSDDRDPQPIFEPLGGYGIGGILIQNGNEVRDCGQNFVANTSDQVFVLKVDPHGLAAIIVGALDGQLSEIPTLFDTPIKIDNLAPEQVRAFGDLQQLGENVFLLTACRTQRPSDTTAKTHHSRKRRFLCNFSFHWKKCHKSKAAHPHRQGARQKLGPLVVYGRKHNFIALFIGKNQWRGGTPYKVGITSWISGKA